MEEVELHLPPDVAYVGLARLIVCAAARQAGMTEERVEDLRIAVSEATANAVVTHRSGEDEDAVVLSFGPTADGAFNVAIAGVGPAAGAADPGHAAVDASGTDVAGAAAHESEAAWSDEAGFGVTVIRGLADDVRFVRGPGSRVEMHFRVALTEDSKAEMGDSGAGVV